MARIVAPSVGLMSAGNPMALRRIGERGTGTFLPYFSARLQNWIASFSTDMMPFSCWPICSADFGVMRSCSSASKICSCFSTMASAVRSRGASVRSRGFDLFEVEGVSSFPVAAFSTVAMHTSILEHVM